MKKLLLFLVLASQMALAQRGLFRGPASTLVPTTPTSPTVVTTAFSDSTVFDITYNTAPSSYTVNVPRLKYGKKAALNVQRDDGGPKGDSTFSVVVNGKAGTPYTPHQFDDGTGKMVDYHYTIGLNWNNTALTDAVNVAQHKKTYLKGFVGHASHSFTHSGYYKTEYELLQNSITMWTSFGNVPRAFIVPVSHPGMVETSLQQYDYVAETSGGFGGNQGASDDNTGLINTVPKMIEIWPISNYTRKPVWTRGVFGDAWSAADLVYAKSYVDRLFNASTGVDASTTMFGSAFSHGLREDANADAIANFAAFWDYVRDHPRNNSSLWVTDLQEFGEWMEFLRKHTKTITPQGKSMRVVFRDPSNVQKRFYDVSFYAPPGMTGVTATGADSVSYNPTTGLVNAYKRRKVFADPTPAVMPPDLIAVYAYKTDSTKVYAKFDRPVSQSVVAGWQAYTANFSALNRSPDQMGTPITINTLSAVAGSNNTIWMLQLADKMTSGKTIIDYQIQRGNAVDASTGQKVSTFFTYPVAWSTGAPATASEKTLTVEFYGFQDVGQTPFSISINGVTQTNPVQTVYTFPAGTVLSSVTCTIDHSANLTKGVFNYNPFPAGTKLNPTVATFTDVNMSQDRKLRFYVNL